MKLAIVLSLLAPVMVWCQTEAAPKFEVASVKVAADPNGFVMTKGGPGTSSPGQWTGTNWSMQMLVTRAWHLFRSQIDGPASMEGAHFDITAKVPPNATPDDFNLMLRSLLLERVGLVVHHEMREQPVYEMTIAKGGLKIKPADTTRAPYTSLGNPIDGGRRMVARMTSFFSIVKWWETVAGRPIIDKTGLSGNYDFVLDFARDAPAMEPAIAGSAPEAPDLLKPGFLDALEKQLGLKLVPMRAPVDVLVVDRFNKIPSD